jgi:hypothetical protein
MGHMSECVSARVCTYVSATVSACMSAEVVLAFVC